MRKLTVLAVVVVLSSAAALLGTGVDVATSRAADHLDSPSVQADGRTDINDFYIFPAQKGKKETALIMTVAPLVGLASPAEFNDAATYMFNIDNTGDAKVDDQWMVTFKGNRMTVRLNGKKMGSGPFGRQGNQRAAPISLRGGGRAWAGMTDDPFFFDLGAAQNGLAFCPGGVGFDFFTNANVMSIVLDVPNGSIEVDNPRAAAINTWASVWIGNKQVDRLGTPFLNTFLGSPKQNAYNKNKQPHKDPKKFGATFTTNMLGLGADAATVAALVGALLPDVLTYSPQALGTRVFPNGRGLEDDVADISLQTLTSNPAATDCVDANDGNFSGKFPYLADAH